MNSPMNSRLKQYTTTLGVYIDNSKYSWICNLFNGVILHNRMAYASIDGPYNYLS